ncbi:MAG: hypothetical protein QM788_06575 [Roseateles sp.]|uniref:hypothetical protein n=1 Tax=Roseateles sp. TaxID=1971397 RepID=UPI0039E7BFAD
MNGLDRNTATALAAASKKVDLPDRRATTLEDLALVVKSGDGELVIGRYEKLPVKDRGQLFRDHGFDGAQHQLKPQKWLALIDLAAISAVCGSMGCDKEYRSMSFCDTMDLCGRQSFEAQADRLAKMVIGWSGDEEARILWNSSRAAMNRALADLAGR